MLARTFTAGNTLQAAGASPVPARHPHVDSPFQFFGNLSSSVSDLLSTGQEAISTVPQSDISLIYLCEYEQDIAAAVSRGRLRAHLLFWVEIGGPSWVLFYFSF